MRFFFHFLLILSLLTLWLLPDVHEGNIYSPLIFAKSNSARFKILVSVVAYWTTGRPFENLFHLLEEYEQYFSLGYEVHVCVDTNSEELAYILSTRKPTQSSREVRVWSLQELGGDPEYLPQKHRQYWEEKGDNFDFFIFTEDDILFTKEAFDVYVARRQMLQEKGWTFGWVIVETWGVDNLTLVAIDQLESRAIKAVFKTPDGQLWSEPLSPYTAQYVLDRDELRNMIEDTSNVWTTGFPAIDKRANIAMGYNYKFSGNQMSNPFGAKGWQSRALVPISGDCKVEQPGGIVRHMPSKYAKSTKLITNNDCIYGGPERKKWGPGSNLDCTYGQIPLSRVFLCHEVEPKILPVWPEGAKLN